MVIILTFIIFFGMIQITKERAVKLYMTIDDKMIQAVDEIITAHGSGHIATRREIISFVHNKFGITEGSIIPSDYCYNRVNDGITLAKPTLFEYVETGKYRCLGVQYPYNGSIYHKELIVGCCENGVRNIFGITDTPVRPFAPKAKSQKSRDPSPRLRFQVLVRDKFTCRFCGASPSKDPSVTLHIDHIMPWSKGGKTTLDNLQTLCSTCNLGKSDIVID